MAALSATDARKSLFGIIRQVNNDHTAVEVVSRHGNAVIMSKDDYDAMTETTRLLRNPANAERLGFASRCSPPTRFGRMQSFRVTRREGRAARTRRAALVRSPQTRIARRSNASTSS